MDSNKDEAKRCLKLAEKYLALGDREKAEKFGRKAQRLFPSTEAEGKRPPKNQNFEKLVDFCILNNKPPQFDKFSLFTFRISI